MTDVYLARLRTFLNSGASAEPEASALASGEAPRAATVAAASLDAGLDFLAGDAPDDFLGVTEGTAEPGPALAAAAPLSGSQSPARAAAAEALLAGLEAAAPLPLSGVLDAIETSDGAPDYDATWVALASVAAGEGQGTATRHGRVSQLVRGALQSGAPELGLLACEAVRRLSLAELQDAVAQLLCDSAEGLGFRGVELVLDCLAEVGDGRCVRSMEAALVSARDVLTEHQAWRARHIVQLIRRDHRR